MKDENVTLILGGGPFDFLGMGWVILKKKVDCKHTCT